MRNPIALAPVLALALACQSTSQSSLQVVAPATAAERAALIERVKSLAGTWETTLEGKTQVAAVFSVSSNGSAVREVMFPGTPNEMTNMYTMDGDSLVMTHYCAFGNQPRMRARAGGTPDSLGFAFDGVSNLGKADDPYMGSMTLTFLGPDRVHETWVHYREGARLGDDTVLELTRKR
jgi:hypothetical protein